MACRGTLASKVSVSRGRYDIGPRPASGPAQAARTPPGATPPAAKKNRHAFSNMRASLPDVYRITIRNSSRWKNPLGRVAERRCRATGTRGVGRGAAGRKTAGRGALDDGRVDARGAGLTAVAADGAAADGRSGRDDGVGLDRATATSVSPRAAPAVASAIRAAATAGSPRPRASHDEGEAATGSIVTSACGPLGTSAVSGTACASVSGPSAAPSSIIGHAILSTTRSSSPAACAYFSTSARAAASARQVRKSAPLELAQPRRRHAGLARQIVERQPRRAPRAADVGDRQRRGRRTRVWPAPVPRRETGSARSAPDREPRNGRARHRNRRAIDTAADRACRARARSRGAARRGRDSPAGASKPGRSSFRRWRGARRRRPRRCGIGPSATTAPSLRQCG